MAVTNTNKRESMNKFNLERALDGDKVITRDGREVTQLTNFNVRVDYMPLTGVVDKALRYWHLDGTNPNKLTADGDLFMAPKKLSGFVNVYDNRYQPSPIHLTRELADEHCEPSTRLACIDISQFNEGHGL